MNYTNIKRVSVELINGSLLYQEGIEAMIKLFAPFAPHMIEELWHTARSHGISSSYHLAGCGRSGAGSG
jgi:leucyl-tRNA synthetase